MDESVLNRTPLPDDVPVVDQNHPLARRCTCEKCVNEIAEAADTIRLYQLLQRPEYRPVAVVRCGHDGLNSVRVYFRRTQAI